jgi:hypothetical protein
LPHFQTSQRRSMLFTVGVTPETLYDKVLRPMARYGMLEMIGADQFQFRSPIYRFVDLCLQFAEEDWESLSTDNGSQKKGVQVASAEEEIESLSADEDDELEDVS